MPGMENRDIQGESESKAITDLPLNYYLLRIRLYCICLKGNIDQLQHNTVRKQLP